MATNVQGVAESALIVFSGFVSEANPPDIPAGSAVIATDVDFTVASVRTRDGLANVYTYAGYDEQELPKCASNVPNGPNGTPWSNPANVELNAPPAYASVTLGPGSGGGGPVPTTGLQNTLVQISAAQLKGIGSTGTITLIPAQGANIAIVPLSTTVQINFVTTAYSGNPLPTIGFGSSQSDVNTRGFMMFVDFTNTLFAATETLIEFDTVTGSGQSAGAYNPTSPFIVNQPLVWVNGVDISSDPGDSTLTLNIQWIAVNVLTGAVVGGTGKALSGALVTLTPTEAASLTPTQIIPAPSANQAIIVVSSTTWNHAASSANDQLMLQVPLGTDYFELGAFGVPVVPTAVLNQPLSYVGGITAEPINNVLGYGTTTTPVKNSYVTTINQGYAIANWVANSDSLSSVGVYVQYMIVDLTTGTVIPGQGDISPSFTALSAAQLKSATPVQLAAAPGANQLLSPVSFVATSHFITTPFSPSGGSPPPFPQPSVGPATDPTFAANQYFLAPNFTEESLFTDTNDQIIVGTPQTGTGFWDVADAVDAPILWAIYNAANLSPSNADSTGTIMVQYIPVNLVNGQLLNSVAPISQVLQGQCFGFSVPSDSTILDVVVAVNGKQSLADPGSVVNVGIVGSPMLLATGTQLPLTDGTLCFDLGNDFTPAQVNDPGFGLGVQAFASAQVTTFDLSGYVATVYFTPPGLTQFDYVKTFEMTNGEVLTLALDSNGIFWQEDANNPVMACSESGSGISVSHNVLTPFYTAIEPNTFARSVTQDDREFIALSDLAMGTDMPRAYNGQWIDRLSQVGPGASPSFSATSNEFDIASITQPPAVVNAGTFAPFRAVLWSSGVGIKHTAGNIFSLYYSFHTSPPDPNVVVGNYVYLHDFATTAGVSPDGTYQIIDAGVIAGGPGGPCNYFSVQVASSQNAYYQPGAGPLYNITMATITLAAPDATVQVGTQISISGATPSTWNDTWTILAALNAAQLTITATSLSAGVATYDFTIISGVAPTIGQQVTITGTTNGDGIFNVTNGVVNSASPTSFSLLIDAADVPPASEANGNAIVNGTIFQFDVGPKYAGTADDPILGNDTGTGTIVQAGQLGAGTRMGTVMFLTRNGFLTAPGPPVTFTVNEGASTITATNIPIGPPNVIARVIALTGANGAFFFWLDIPTIITNSGQAITYSSTVIQDNVTTQVTLNLTDAVLLAGLSIDAQGSNNFAEIELGSSIGVTSYASRIFAWGEQNKIQNLLNWSFDGGYIAANTQSNLVPLGWTVDQTNGSGGQLTVSPLFGNAYYIKNSTGSTQALYGMIWQTAFQDYNQVPIITPQTEYSVRVTARSPSGAASGNLVVDLYSPSFGVAYGAFSIPLSSLTTSMQILTGTLLTTAFTTEVPDDLRLRVYASQIPDGADVELDRLEPFNTAQPTLTTNLRGSYFNNFEAFDGVTGDLGVGSQNQQPVRNTFSLFDNLYVVKTKSFYSTSDNGTTEPNFWNVREVSNKVGTPSIYGVDVGEGWALIVGQAGLYIFTGGDPIKISPELDGNPGFWQAINWKYGNTIWLRNDTNNRKIYIGIPIATPNFWCPSFPVNVNPTQPNVVLVLNYKELMTSSALAGEGSMRLTYTGELKTYTLGRKWSAWSIEACYADFITRGDTTEPLFFCGDTSSGRIYQQIAGNYADDGKALHCDYVTYAFPKTKEAQELQMGLHQLQASFMTILANGNGNLRMTVYPDSIESPNQEALYPEALYNPPPEGDLEIPLNIEGNRFFVGLQIVDPGEWFEISRIVMALGPNPWAPLRGK